MIASLFRTAYVLLVWTELVKAEYDLSYIGCFGDSDDRLLPDLIHCDLSRYPYTECLNQCDQEQLNYCQSNAMSMEICRDMCADQNMKYIGLQAGTQCFCGGNFANVDESTRRSNAISLCNRFCSGNSSQICGGEYYISIYRLNSPQSDCFNPGYVPHTIQSKHDDVFKANDTVDFSTVCLPPNNRTGSTTITCTTGGNWTDSPPTCTVRCPTPTVPTEATFSGGQALLPIYAEDDEVLFDCIHDSNMTNEVLECGYYGDWETAVMCPALGSTTELSSESIVEKTTQSTMVSTNETEVGLSSSSTPNAPTSESLPTVFTSTDVSRFTSPTVSGQLVVVVLIIIGILFVIAGFSCKIFLDIQRDRRRRARAVQTGNSEGSDQLTHTYHQHVEVDGCDHTIPVDRGVEGGLNGQVPDVENMKEKKKSGSTHTYAEIAETIFGNSETPEDTRTGGLAAGNDPTHENHQHTSN